MHIDALQIAQIAGTAITAGTALAGALSGPGALRARLRHDVDLIEKLPADSDARRHLLEHIDHQVGTVANLDKNARRDIQGAFVSAIMIALFGWLGFYLIDLSDWWWQVLGAASLIFATVGGLPSLFEDLQRVPRDAKGKRVT